MKSYSFVAVKMVLDFDWVYSVDFWISVRWRIRVRTTLWHESFTTVDCNLVITYCCGRCKERSKANLGSSVGRRVLISPSKQACWTSCGARRVNVGSSDFTSGAWKYWASKATRSFVHNNVRLTL